MFKKICLALCLVTVAFGGTAYAQSASGQPLKVYPPGAYVGSPAISPAASSAAYGGGASGYAPAQSYAPAGQNGFYSGPDSTVGPYNPHSNLRGNMTWVSFAQRTPSFGQSEGAGLGRPVYSGPVYSSSTPKKKAKKVAVAKKKTRTVKIPPKGTKEFEDFCQEMIEMCKDYLPAK